MTHHWTDKTDEEADALYATFSEREIRNRQDLTSQQLAIAHVEATEHGRDMADAIADLRRQEDALTRAMLARLQPTNEET